MLGGWVGEIINQLSNMNLVLYSPPFEKLKMRTSWVDKTIPYIWCINDRMLFSSMPYWAGVTAINREQPSNMYIKSVSEAIVLLVFYNKMRNLDTKLTECKLLH